MWSRSVQCPTSIKLAFGHRTDAPDLTKEALRSDERASPVSKHANRSTEPPVCLASGASTCRPKARVLVRSRPRSPPTSSTATRGASNSRAALSGGAVNSMTSLNPGASAVLDADGHWAKESTARRRRITPVAGCLKWDDFLFRARLTRCPRARGPDGF